MSTTSKPRLTYFSSRGRAEVIRIILAETNTDYEEVNVGKWHPTDKTEEFKSIVDNLAFGALPLWEEPSTGLSLVQSMAIVRHLARTKGLYGKNVEEAARCDMIAEGLLDFGPKFASYRDASDPAKKEEIKKRLLEQDIPKHCAFFEKLLQSNSGGKGFFVGDQLTYADLGAWFTFENLSDQGIINLDQFPLIKAFKERIESRPNIAAYKTNPKRFPVQPVMP